MEREYALFDKDHLAHLGDRAGLQPIQIHAAGHALAAVVAPVPMGRAGTGQVLPRRAVAQIQRLNQRPPNIVDTFLLEVEQPLCLLPAGIAQTGDIDPRR